MVRLVLVLSFALVWLGTVDRTEVGIVLVRGNSVIFEVLINVPRLPVLNAAGAAVDDFLFGESNEGGL